MHAGRYSGSDQQRKVPIFANVDFTNFSFFYCYKNLWIFFSLYTLFYKILGSRNEYSISYENFPFQVHTFYFPRNLGLRMSIKLIMKMTLFEYSFTKYI